MPATEKYETFAGETIRFPKPGAKLQKFLTQIQTAAEDESVGPGELDALIYGKRNPLLDHAVNKGTALEGFGALTAETLANPVYHVMQDLAHRKRAQFTHVKPDHSKDVFTMRVPEIVRELDDMSEDGVRRLLREDKIANVKDGDGFRADPRSVQAYKATRKKRGPKRKPALTCRYGSEPGNSFSVKALGVVKGESLKKGTLRTTEAVIPEFETAAVKMTGNFRGKKGQHCVILERATRRNRIQRGRYFIEGLFKIVEEVETAAAAGRRFTEFEPV
jgi:hypothetical protein